MSRGYQPQSDSEAQMSLKLNDFSDDDYVPDENYEPGASVHTVSSRGQMRRVKSKTTGRVVYLLSLLEYIVFLILDIDPNVIDIEEQRKHELQHTLRRAFELGINHPPQNAEEKKELTTDFVVTLRGQPHQKVAIYVKYAKDLNNYRTIEKLQLERDSLAKESIPLYVVTEEQINRKTHLTLEWILGTSIDDCNFNELSTHVEAIKGVFDANPTERIAVSLTSLDEESGCPGGTHLTRFKQLVQFGIFQFEFTKDFFDLTGNDIEVLNG